MNSEIISVISDLFFFCAGVVMALAIGIPVILVTLKLLSCLQDRK